METKLTQHTPGPWMIAPNYQHPAGRGQHGAIYVIADGPCDTHLDNDDWHIATTFNRDNARLIASAPELLEALEEILNVSDPDDLPLAAYRVQARAAIAKARGG